jgi:hypothetical protein
VKDIERDLQAKIFPVTDDPSDLLHVIREGKPSKHRRTRSGWEAELAKDGNDRFHDPLPAETDKMIPLFNKPANIWPILPAGLSSGSGGSSEGGCGGGSCG